MTNQENQYKKYLLIALLIPLVVVTGRWAKGGYDITHFIVAGDLTVDSVQHPYPIKINENSAGYDGVQFYLYSIKPNLKQHKYLGIGTDLSYRKQRILYPLTVWLLSFGNPTAVPYIMVLVNLLCVFVLILVSARMIRKANAPPYYILLIAGLTGIYIALTRNLAETMEAMFLVLCFTALFNKNILGFVLSATAVMLTRETNVLVILPAVLVLLLYRFKQKELFRWQSIAILLPLVVLFCWKGYLFLHYGYVSRDDIQFVPFCGIIDGFYRVFSFQVHPDRYGYFLHICYGLYNFTFLLWVAVTLFIAFKNIRQSINFLNLWILSTIAIMVTFGLFLGYPIYVSDISFLRVFNGVLLLAFMALAVSKTKLPPLYVGTTILLQNIALVRVILIT